MPVFLKNDWYMAAWSSEIGNTPMARQIVGESIVLFRDAQGKVCALRDQCCHRGAALSPGRVVADGIECPYHGMVFDGSGKCVHIPTQDNIPAKACVPRFAVEERDQIVWLWAGKPEEADVSLIVGYPYHDDPKWPNRQGRLHVKCGYEMMLDNIMDLTHVAYVHKNTIGGTPNAHAAATMKTERTSRGVKFARWLRNSVPAPTYSRAVEMPERIDRWQEEDLIVPCTIIQFTGGVDVAQDAYNGGSREGGFAMRVLHCIVPETATTCHYFFSVANGFSQDKPEVTEILRRDVIATIEEDVVICESQQLRRLQYPDTRLVDLKSDEARVLYRRHLAARLAAESAEVDPAASLAPARVPASEMA